MAKRRLSPYLPLPHRDLLPAEYDNLYDGVIQKRSDAPEPELQPQRSKSSGSDASDPTEHNVTSFINPAFNKADDLELQEERADTTPSYDTSDPVQLDKVAKTDQLIRNVLKAAAKQPATMQTDYEVSADALQASAPRTTAAAAAPSGCGEDQLSSEKQDEKGETEYGSRRCIRDSILARDNRWDNSLFVKGRPMMIVITTDGREVAYNRATTAARAAQDTHKKEAEKDEAGDEGRCTLN
ncbi:hypothetical protein AAVH_37411 [Aphelenchoides avenae]|nr:hypothetical protein AAVH_37411 [Aphelenchus avenae]